MKSVTIGFSAPVNWKPGAELIMLWQGGTSYSHVYIKCYNDWLDKTIIYQASHGMVNCEEDSTFFKQNKVIKEFYLNRTDDQYKATISKCVELLGTPYSYTGLIVTAFSDVVTNVFNFFKLNVEFLKTWGDGQKSFYCSEFAANIFPEISQYTNKNLDRIEPVDMYNAILKFQEAQNG